MRRAYLDCDRRFVGDEPRLCHIHSPYLGNRRKTMAIWPSRKFQRTYRLPRLRARSLCTFLSIPFLSLSSYSSLFSTSEKLPRLREPTSFTLSRARELNKFATRERCDDLVSFPRFFVYFSDVLGFVRIVWAYGSNLIYAAWNWHDR